MSQKKNLSISLLIGQGLSSLRENGGIAIKLALCFGLLSTVLVSPALSVISDALDAASGAADSVEGARIAQEIIGHYFFEILALQGFVILLFHTLLIPYSRLVFGGQIAPLEGGASGITLLAARISLQSLFAFVLQYILTNMIGVLIRFISPYIGEVLSVGLYFVIVVWLQFVFVALAIVLNAVQASAGKIKLMEAFGLLQPMNGTFTAATASITLVGLTASIFAVSLLISLVALPFMVNVASALLSAALYLIAATMVGALKAVPHIADQTR